MRKNDAERTVIMETGTNTYMTTKDMAKWYGVSPQTIRTNVAGMRETGRYNQAYLVLDPDGKMLVNTLMYEDYLANKRMINAGLIKTLKPYDPMEVRRQRGEYRMFLEQLQIS